MSSASRQTSISNNSFSSRLRSRIASISRHIRFTGLERLVRIFEISISNSSSKCSSSISRLIIVVIIP
ncbi:Uncharacterised protein [Vibrio cholerae]|nr:Uncharacterised protein [Vibrio cholerae]